MKSMKLFLAMAIALVLGISTAQAQTLAGAVRATIPFQFTVAGKTLDAGDYLITTSQAKTIVIKSIDSNQFAIAMTNGLESLDPKEPKLVFRRSGERYFLAQIWTGTSGRQVPVPSSKDLKIARFDGDHDIPVSPAK
jgi:hypothetical protein